MPVPQVGDDEALVKGTRPRTTILSLADEVWQWLAAVRTHPTTPITSLTRAPSYLGICGTDAHIHHGDFIAGFPLIPGHEVCGTVAAVGKDVTVFEHGERVVADPSVVASIRLPFRISRDR